MRGWGVGVVLGAALVAGSAAWGARAEPVARATSGWQVDAGSDQCLALRRYAVGQRPVLLAFEPEPGENSGRLSFRIEDKAHRIDYGSRGIKLLIGGRLLTTFALIVPAKDEGALISVGYNLDPGEPPLLKGQREITLRSLMLTASFPLGPMDALGKVLDACNADLLATWGFPLADQGRMATRPTWEPTKVFTSADYPADALKDRRSGTVWVRYAVDAEGRASDCVVRRSSLTPSLDAATCRIITTRARFTPALDKAGQRMRAVDTARVRWVVPIVIFRRVG